MNPSNTSGAQKTPANANVGEDKPKMFDEHGTIGKQFTRMFLIYWV
jgi:hypothetical protein